MESREEQRRWEREGPPPPTQDSYFLGGCEGRISTLLT